MQHHATPYNTIQHHATPCKTMQHHAKPCNIMVPYNTIKHHTALWHHTAPCNNIQHYRIASTKALSRTVEHTGNVKAFREEDLIRRHAPQSTSYSCTIRPFFEFSTGFNRSFLRHHTPTLVHIPHHVPSRSSPLICPKFS